MSADPYILWLQDCNKNCLSQVGGKCASLGEMIQAGIHVPPGFAVTTAAYRDFLEKAGIAQEIQRMLAGIGPDDVEATETASQTIRQMMGLSIPAQIEDAIAGA
jgi:pyruvate,water dikinase